MSTTQHAQRELRDVLAQFDPVDLLLPEILALLAVLRPVAARVQAGDPTTAVRDGVAPTAKVIPLRLVRGDTKADQLV